MLRNDLGHPSFSDMCGSVFESKWAIASAALKKLGAETCEIEEYKRKDLDPSATTQCLNQLYQASLEAKLADSEVCDIKKTTIFRV